jgi:PAS domain S-box-containing protein
MVGSPRPGLITSDDVTSLPATAAVRRPSALLVDDRPANLLALEALLEPLEARLVRASSGEEALARLASDEFALVLLDVQMPGLDGLETLARLRARERGVKTPVLFVTAGVADPARVGRAYQLGAVDFIPKPLDADALRAKVMVFLELYEAREEVRRHASVLRARDLADSERKYRFLADATPEIVWTESPDGRMTYVNRRFVEYAGVPPERALGTGWGATLHADDVRRFRGCRERAARDGDAFEVECRLRRRDGAFRWFVIRAVPRHDAQGAAVVEWVGTATDIDDWKRAEAEREALLARERAARELAVEASRAKDEFLASVTHELRAPLNAIAGWAELLGDEAVDALHRRRALTVIKANVEVQTRLIDDLLDLGRIVAGTLRLDIGLLRLDAVVRAALDMVIPAADAKRIVLTASLDDVGEIQGDRGRLQQVASNLLTNAVKFTPEGGRVEARLARRGAHVELRVTDTGAGIAPHLLPHVFDRFRQARAGEGGLGLGLSIVKSLVELHGGVVSAESAGEGRGSTFVVLLPTPSAFRTAAASPGSARTSSPDFDDLVPPPSGSDTPARGAPPRGRTASAPDLGPPAPSALGPGAVPAPPPPAPPTSSVQGSGPPAQAALSPGGPDAAGSPAAKAAPPRPPTQPPVPDRSAPPAPPPDARIIRPYDPDATPVRTTSRRPASQRQLEGARVLVVDDDADARYFVTTTLRSHGAEVVGAESAHEAFYLFQRTRPDVLVSDISMPNEDGCSLVRNVRRLAPGAGGTTPAVALTALDRPDDRARALLAGFTMYLIKPTTEAEFVTVLSKLVELARKR